LDAKGLAMIAKFVLVLALIGAVAATDPAAVPQPGSPVEKGPDHKEPSKEPIGTEPADDDPTDEEEEPIDPKFEIDQLKKAGFYEAYVKCIKETVQIFGKDWIKEQRKSLDTKTNMFTSFLFPYAYQYYCEDIGLGMLDPKTHLQDEAAFTKVIEEKVKDAELKEEYLKLAKCYGKCNRGESPNPNIKVEGPTEEQKKNPLVTKQIIEYAPKAHNLDYCGAHCGWPKYNHAELYEWDELVYTELINQLGL